MTVSVSMPHKSRAVLPALSGFGWMLMLAIGAALVLVPVVSVGVSALQVGEGLGAHLASTVLPRYVAGSFWLCLWVGVLVAVLGTGTAWLVVTCRFPGRNLFNWALVLPLALPAYVIAYTYTGLLDYAGPVQSGLRDLFGWRSAADYAFFEIRSLPGAVAMFALVLYPYVYVLARAAFAGQSGTLMEAARIGGAGPGTAFRKVALPVARPAIVAGVALALMEVLGDYGTVSYFAVDTFTTGIFRTWFGLGDLGGAARLSCVLLIVVAALLALERGSRRPWRTLTDMDRQAEPVRLRGLRAAGATLFCTVPVALGFLVPAAALMVWTGARVHVLVDAKFLSLLGNSLLLAALATVTVLVLATLLSYARRLSEGRVGGMLTGIAGLGYALPGAVVAVGLMLPAAGFDNALDAWMRSTFGISTGLLLSGGLVLLVLAMAVRFMTIGLRGVGGALEAITPAMDRSARILGLGPASVLRRVHVPILRPALLSAGLLVFVDVLKELPATLILRPIGFDTLAVRTYELASDERLRDAAPSALAIVLAGLVPVILISRDVLRRARNGGGL